MSATILREAWTENKTSYECVFDDGQGNGYGFNCDKCGNLLPMHECAVNNYHMCMEHPEKFVRFNEVISWNTKIHHGATIKCTCGNVMELYGEYNGSCKCGKCNQWYNMFGQSLVPPEYWEEDGYSCCDEYDEDYQRHDIC